MSQYKETTQYVKEKIGMIANSSPARSSAILAELRRGLGKAPGTLPGLWEWTLEGLPEELKSRSDQPTNAEWAIHICMTLYAFHQQGRSPAGESMNKNIISLGKAVSLLAGNQQEDRDRYQKKLEMLTKTDSIEMMAALLRQIVAQLRGGGIPLDYPALAGDILAFQFEESRLNVLLKWGQDFYSFKSNNEIKSEKGEESLKQRSSG